MSYPTSRGGELQVISFQRKKPRFPTETTAETDKPAQAAKTPTWGISGQMSGLECPAAHIEQSAIELPLHKKGDKPSGQKPPAQSRMGHGMGHERKTQINADKQKRPETA